MNNNRNSTSRFRNGSSGSGHESGSGFKPRGRGFGGKPRFGAGPRGRSGGRGGRGGFASQSFRDVSKFINKVSITEEADIFKPEHAFNDFLIDAQLKEAIAKKKYITPTPIQDKSIPHILKGADIVGIANTGTGKTAAFLIPIINKILANRTENALIVVPTRELAIQIQEEFRGFALHLNMHSVCVVGGAAMYPQVSALRRPHNIIVGTPGRLKDLIERKCINLAKFKTVVLDEADRMLDMGFINDVKYMMSLMPAERQTLFFSATLSSDIAALISRFLKNPITISVKTRDTSQSIDQDIVRVNPGERKLDKLQTLLKDKSLTKVLIFGKTKHGVELLAKDLVKSGFAAESIHGNKNHSKRQKALGQFKNNQINILVATDVAARGLDIADVSHVINYDLPATYEDYIHRIGRTGRAGKSGKALTFV